ncbi:exonuclease V, chloroplastic [Humulus lupulus]|uniref:exonuclease V, chloroplastic n=1 Tax=Humulus lupulus TaxID=3486 RepID=UPI002B400ED8|nr:exonuclease V, chloroplastic [Humulus lupulus]
MPKSIAWTLRSIEKFHCDITETRFEETYGQLKFMIDKGFNLASSREEEVPTYVREPIVELHWESFCGLCVCSDEEVVREFYANLLPSSTDYVIVRENRVPLTSAAINVIFGLPDIDEEDDDYVAMLKEWDWELAREVLVATSVAGTKWEYSKQGSHTCRRKFLVLAAKLWKIANMHMGALEREHYKLRRITPFKIERVLVEGAQVQDLDQNPHDDEPAANVEDIPSVSVPLNVEAYPAAHASSSVAPVVDPHHNNMMEMMHFMHQQQQAIWGYAQVQGDKARRHLISFTFLPYFLSFFLTSPFNFLIMGCIYYLGVFEYNPGTNTKSTRQNMSCLQTVAIPTVIFPQTTGSTKMTESALYNDDHHQKNCSHIPKIPIEIVSEEEMVLLEAAMVSARSCISSSAIPVLRSSHLHTQVRSIQSITALSKRGFSGSKEPDMEDLGDFRSTQKKTRLPDSFYLRFRSNKGLFVTDFTDTEWCEKQKEYSLLGKRIVTRAMKKGTARHAKLEEEVVTKVKVSVKSVEDRWALKLLNFIIGVNQLLFEGLTRELPLVSYVEGVWIVGVIDEIRMPITETDKHPLLVDTKTRVRRTLPSEPQRRNGRFQLMCYKRMWDTLVSDNFPTKKFLDYYNLNPYNILSEEIIERTAKVGFPAQTLQDVMKYYSNTCSVLPFSHDNMLLRYESQQDNSLLGEDHFAYDLDWLQKQIHVSLEFWHGKREASYTPEEEHWKCRVCQFAHECPGNAYSNSSSSSPTNLSPSSPTISTPDNNPRC